MAAHDHGLGPKFELEAIAVKEGHVVKNLKRRYFRLVGDPSNRSLFLYYGVNKQQASNFVDLVGAKLIDRTDALGNFSSEHVCSMHLDKKLNRDTDYFAMCFDSPAVCREWKACVHSFNSASSTAAETRELLSLIQDSLDAGSLPARHLVTLRNLCVRNAVFRSAVMSSDAGTAILAVLLQHEDEDTQLCAITTVAACCDNQHRAQTFQSAGFLVLLLRCTQQQRADGGGSSHGRNAEAAMVAIAQMCSASPSCQDALKDAAGLNLFLKVMGLMRSKRQDCLLLKKLASSKFPPPYANTVIKYGMICKEGHIRKSLKNRYFELKVGENFEPLLFVYYSQEDADQGAYKYRLNLAAAEVYLTKNVRDGYSPGCCKRVFLQPPPLNPFTKLTLCFDATEEAQLWCDAIQWSQQARQILDDADAEAAAALEVPIPREEPQTHPHAAFDSLPDLLPDLCNVADLTPPPPRPTLKQAPLDQTAPPPPAPPPQSSQPPPPPPPAGAKANPAPVSTLAPAFVMLDISHLNLPRLSEIQRDE